MSTHDWEVINNRAARQIRWATDDFYTPTVEEQKQIVRDEAKKYFERDFQGRIERAIYAAKLAAPQQFLAFDDFDSYRFSMYQYACKELNTTAWASNEQLKHNFNELCKYFSGFDVSSELSINKGIRLVGGLGCGKTFWLKLFRQNPFRSYKIVSAIELSRLYEKNGTSVLDTYGSELASGGTNCFGQTQTDLCIDDMGAENEESKNYGNARNVIKDIIEERYYKGLRVHLSSNLTLSQIEERYGSRAASRIEEMCNVVNFTGLPDFRKLKNQL